MLPFRGPLTISRVSVLAWRSPGTGKPGGLPSMGPHRVGHDWSDLAAAAAAESVLVATSGVGGEGCCCHPGASRASRVALVVKKAPASAGGAGDVGSIPGSGGSPGGGNGNPLQHSCLEHPHGQRSLAGYSPWGHTELDTAEWLSRGVSSIPQSTRQPQNKVCDSNHE